MFGNFEEEARKVLVIAKEEMNELNHPYVSSEHLLLGILKTKNNVSEKLLDYELTYSRLKKEIIKVIGKGSKKSEYFLYTPLLKRVIENAIMDAKDNNGGVVTVNHLFSGILEEGEGVAIRILIGMDIDIDDLYSDFTFSFTNKANKKLLLEELGVNLNKKATEGKLDPVTGRDKEIKRILEILSRRCKNNPLLIGKAGVGKTAIVEEVANMITRGEVPINLKNKKIISLDMATSVAGTKYRGEFEERMNKILKEIEENEDIILFIDEIHTLVGAGGAEGAIDASNIFKPALARGTIRCIGATTTEEYKKYIEKDSALERRFQKITIEEPDNLSLKNILMNLKEIYESYHKVIIDEEIVDLIIKLSDKYIYDRYQPDKAIDILDEVCAKTSLKESKNLKKYRQLNKNLKNVLKLKKESIIDNDFNKASLYKKEEFKLMNDINNMELNLYKTKVKKVSKNDVALVVNSKTNIPVYELLNEKKQVLKNAEKIMKNNLIGQDEAVTEVCNIIKKIKLGLNDKCYSMMFCGPSGVGKTYLAKIFGKYLVGERNIIKLDMSEFKEAHSISKIIGAPAGYVGYEDKSVLDEIKEKPYSVLILDEIEHAHSNIANLFLQVLDEGVMKDSKANQVRFDNVVIIMTSNIGFHTVNVGFNSRENIKTKLTENFSIPFINRVDKVITFNRLNKENIDKIINIRLNKLKKKYKGKIDIKISNKVISDIEKLCCYEEYGARKIDKVIKNHLETIIVDSLLNGTNIINIKTIEKQNI